MSENEEYWTIWGMRINRTISVVTIFNILVMIVTVVSTLGYTHADVKSIKEDVAEQKLIQQRMQTTLREDYLNREQVEYIILQRMDRLEESVNEKFERILEKIDEQ